MKASKLRAQLHREGFELEGGSVGTRTPSSVLACGCTPALEVEQPTAQTCWRPGGCPTADPAPGLTPLAGGLRDSARTRDSFPRAQTRSCPRREAVSWDWYPGSQDLPAGTVKRCGERACPLPSLAPSSSASALLSWAPLSSVPRGFLGSHPSTA